MLVGEGVAGADPAAAERAAAGFLADLDGARTEAHELIDQAGLQGGGGGDHGHQGHDSGADDGDREERPEPLRPDGAQGNLDLLEKDGPCHAPKLRARVSSPTQRHN